MLVGCPRRLMKAVPGLALFLGVALALSAALSLPATAAAAAKLRPVVISISPKQGGVAGGTMVTVRGRHFKASGKSLVKAVKFGKAFGTKIHVRSSTTLTVRAPRGAKGTVAVRVTTKWGTSALAKADHYVYKSVPPVVKNLSPSTGPTLGGTRVTVSGAGFSGATAVWFGSVPATSFTVSSDATIVAVAPPQGAAGDPYDVIVTTAFGTSAAVAADEFNYYAPAVVGDVSPRNGPRAGGTQVTIAGNYLFAVTAVRFGGVAATRFSVKSNSTIVATAPPGSGTVDVTVTTPAGISATSSADWYSYAAQIVASSATTQSQVVGQPVGTPPSIKVTDALGNPVKGVDVTFTVTSGKGSITGATPATNDSGIATLGSWTLGATAGPNTLTAAADGLAPVTFSATGLAGAAYQISANSAQVQSATAGGPVGTLPSVVVKDANGNVVEGVPVTFAVASGGGSVNGAGTTVDVTTDTLGVATVGSWTLGPNAGVNDNNTLTASGPTDLPLAGSPVTFTATGTVGPPSQIVPNSTQTQSATAGGPVGTLPSVVVKDANGNPVAGVSVTFAVASGGGTVNGAGTTVDVTTGTLGVATVGSWTLGPSAGTNTLRATATSVSGSVTFTATGTITVTAVANIADIPVDNGTPSGSVPLPSAVGVTLSNGQQPTVGVSWDGGTPTYDGDTAGSYVFAGTLSLPSGVTNPSHLAAKVTVVVQS